MMSDERGPPHKTTTGQPVTVTTTTTTASPVVTFDWIKIKLDVDYFKALPGIIKLVQLVSSAGWLMVGLHTYFLLQFTFLQLPA